MSCALIGQSESTSGSPTTASPRAPGRLQGTSRITIYFPRLLEDGALGLASTERDVPSEGLPGGALQALIDGPNGDERAADYQYPLSPFTGVSSFEVSDGIATVEFDGQLDRVRGRPFSELAYWAIVYTLTEVSGIQGVSLIKDRLPLEQFGYPPLPIPQVARRADAPIWVRPT